MTKIFLVPEKIKNEVDFIKNIKPLTNASIIELKKSIRDHTPFFTGLLSGSTAKETEKKVQQILAYCNKQGDVISLYEAMDNHAETYSDEDKITQEIFFNSLDMDKEINEYFDKLDQEES